METILQSFLMVAATEMGDKTQLLALVLASRFRQPWAVLAGIFVATVLNHFMAASLGNWFAQQLSPDLLRWILGLVFIAFAVWILIPDKEDGESERTKYGAFLTTLVTFFLAEMGDKTQLSTIALAAKYQDTLLVTIGTTLGMMFSDGLAILFGEKITERISLKAIRIFSSLLFVIFGLAIIFHS